MRTMLVCQQSLPFKNLLPPLMLAALLSGCASGGQTVVLVPDPDGKVGKVEVSTAGGKQLLEKNGDMTHTTGASKAPAPIVSADASYLASTFKEALAIEPPPGEHFTFYYNTGSALPSGDYPALINEIAAAVKRRNALTIRISGHTDATGSDTVDNALSLERVKQMRAMLADKGIKVERIATASHGKGNPAVPTPDGVAEPRNRRVVVIVH